MRTALIQRPGVGADIRLVDVPEPAQPRAGQVLIEVKAAGVGLVDLLMLGGGYEGQDEFPRRVGLEYAGRVMTIGPDVTALEVGDEVCGMVFGPQAAVSDRLLLESRDVVRIPVGVSLTEAATLPSAAMTAYAALHLHGHVRHGDRVLIRSAGSGVGIVAVQMAKAAGACVDAVAGAHKQEALLDLGADRAWDSTVEGWDRDLEGYDIVIDPTGGVGLQRSYDMLRAGGRLVCLDASSQHPAEGESRWQDSSVTFDPVRLVWDAKAVIGVNITAIWQMDGAQGPLLSSSLRAWKSSASKPVVAAVVPVHQIADAFALVARRATFGRVVVALDAPIDLGAPTDSR